MLFVNFICLLYLMVIVNSHTISRSYARTELTDDYYDNFNDIDFKHKSRHAKFHPIRDERVFRRKKQKIADTNLKQIGKQNVPIKETIQLKVDNQDKKQKAITSTKALKKWGRTYYSKLANIISSTPIYSKLVKHMKWKRPQNAKKEKTNKQKFKRKYKKKSKKNHAQSNLERPPVKNKRSLQKVSTTRPRPSTGRQDNLNYNKDITHIISEISTKLDELRRLYTPEYHPDRMKVDEVTKADTDSFEGTAAIEELLSQVKFKTIDMIAKNSPSIADAITNAVTETTYTIDPLMDHLQYITPLYALSTLVTMNDIPVNVVTVNPPETRHVLDDKGSYFVFQTEPTRKSRSAISDTSGLLTLAQGVEESFEGKLRGLIDKLKGKPKVKTTKTSISSTTTQTKKLDDILSSKVDQKLVANSKNLKANSSSKATEANSFTTTKHKRGRHVTSTIFTPFMEDNDFSMLALYEHMLEKSQERNMQKFLSTKLYPTLKRNARNVTTGEQTKRDDEGEKIEITSQVPLEDTTYEGLSKKLAYNDFVNGFRHYLQFEREMAHSNFSNLVRYQAHRHHDVDDIGKYILDKIPQIPRPIQDRYKRGFHDNYDDDQDVSTKSEDSWFKRHFYYFVERSSPKKFHSSQMVPLKPPVERASTEASKRSREDRENSKWSEKENVESEVDLDELSAMLKQRADNTELGINLLEASTNSIESDGSNSQRLFQKFFGMARPAKKPAPKKVSSGANAEEKEGRVRRHDANTMEKQEESDSKYSMDHYSNSATLKTGPDPVKFKDHKKKLTAQANVDIAHVGKKPKKKGRIKSFLDKFKIKKKKKKGNKDCRQRRQVQRRARFNIVDSLRNLLNGNSRLRLTKKMYDDDYEFATKRLEAFKPMRYDSPSRIEELSFDNTPDNIPEVEDKNNKLQDLTVQVKAISEAPAIPDFSKWNPDKYEFEKQIDDILKGCVTDTPETISSPDSDNIKAEPEQIQKSVGKYEPKIDQIVKEIEKIDMRISTYPSTSSQAYYTAQKSSKKKKPQPTTVDNYKVNIESDANASISTLAKHPVSANDDNFDIDSQIESSKDEVFNHLSNIEFNINKKIDRLRNIPSDNKMKINVDDDRRSPVSSLKPRGITVSDYELITKRTTESDDFNDLFIWNRDILHSSSTWRNILHDIGVSMPELETTTEGRSVQDQLDEFMDMKMKFIAMKHKINDHDKLGNKYVNVGGRKLKEERENINKAGPKRDLDDKVSKNVIDILDRLNCLLGLPKEKQQAKYEDRVDNNDNVKGFTMLDPTIYAYDDGIDFITEAPVKLSRSSINPTTGKSHTRSKTKLTTPRQYYSTPLPMEPQAFETFLKMNDLDVKSVTLPLPLDTSEIVSQFPKLDKAKGINKLATLTQKPGMPYKKENTERNKLNYDRTNITKLATTANRDKSSQEATSYSKHEHRRIKKDTNELQKTTNSKTDVETHKDNQQVTLINFDDLVSDMPNMEPFYYENLPLHKDIIENMKLEKALSPKALNIDDIMTTKKTKTPGYTKALKHYKTSTSKHNQLLYYSKETQKLKKKTHNKIQNKSEMQNESEDWEKKLNNVEEPSGEYTGYLKSGTVSDENFHILKYLPKPEKLPKRIRINGQSYKCDIEYKDVEDERLHKQEEQLFKATMSNIGHLMTPPTPHKNTRRYLDKVMNTSKYMKSKTKVTTGHTKSKYYSKKTDEMAPSFLDRMLDHLGITTPRPKVAQNPNNEDQVKHAHDPLCKATEQNFMDKFKHGYNTRTATPHVIESRLSTTPVIHTTTEPLEPFYMYTYSETPDLKGLLERLEEHLYKTPSSVDVVQQNTPKVLDASRESLHETADNRLSLDRLLEYLHTTPSAASEPHKPLQKISPTPTASTEVHVGPTRYIYNKLLGRLKSKTKCKDTASKESRPIVGFQDYEMPPIAARKLRRLGKISKILKRQAESFTAKNVAGIDVIVRLVKGSTCPLDAGPAVKVRIEIPSAIQDGSDKRSLESFQKLFTAKLLTTDQDNQVQSTTSKFSLPMYLLVENPDGTSGSNFIFKYSDQHKESPKYNHDDKVTTTPNNKLNKVTLSKDFVSALNEHLDNMYAKMTANYTHRIHSREVTDKSLSADSNLAKTTEKTATKSMKSIGKDKSKHTKPHTHDHRKNTTKSGPTFLSKLQKLFHLRRKSSNNVTRSPELVNGTFEPQRLATYSFYETPELGLLDQSTEDLLITSSDVNSNNPAHEKFRRFKSFGSTTRQIEKELPDSDNSLAPPTNLKVYKSTRNLFNKLWGRTTMSRATNTGDVGLQNNEMPLVARKPKRRGSNKGKRQAESGRTPQSVKGLEYFADPGKTCTCASTHENTNIERPVVNIYIQVQVPNHKNEVFSENIVTPNNFVNLIDKPPEKNTATTLEQSKIYLLLGNKDATAKEGDFIVKAMEGHVELISDEGSTNNKSKNLIAAVKERLQKMYAKENSKEIEKKIRPRNVEVKKRSLNWRKLRNFFGNERACSCKCKVNKTMCRACAASDAVMGELIFEINRLVSYMTEHCTEIQTYFLMNPTGGKKLRDAVRKVDRSLQNYYKRVKGKCNGKTCDAFRFIDKRFVHTMPSEYIETRLTDDIEDVAFDIDNAAQRRICLNDKLKEGSSKLFRVISNCAKENAGTPKNKEFKNTNSLDNVKANILGNTESISAIRRDAMDDVDNLQVNDNKPIVYHTETTKETNKYNFRHAFLVSHNKKTQNRFRKRDIPNDPLNADSGGSFWINFINVDRTQKLTTGYFKKTRSSNLESNMTSDKTTEKTYSENNTEDILHTDTTESYSKNKKQISTTEQGTYELHYDMHKLFQFNDDLTESTTDKTLTKNCKKCCKCCKNCCECCKNCCECKGKSKCKFKCKCKSKCEGEKNATKKVENSHKHVTIKPNKTVRNKTASNSPCSHTAHPTITNATTAKETKSNNKIGKWKNATTNFIKNNLFSGNQTAHESPNDDLVSNSLLYGNDSLHSDISHKTEGTNNIHPDITTTDNPTIIILNDDENIVDDDMTGEQSAFHKGREPASVTTDANTESVTRVESNHYKDLLLTILKYEGKNIEKDLRHLGFRNSNSPRNGQGDVVDGIINLRIKIINESATTTPTPLDYGLLEPMYISHTNSSTTESVISKLLTRLFNKKQSANKVVLRSVVSPSDGQLLQSSTVESDVAEAFDSEVHLNAEGMVFDGLSPSTSPSLPPYTPSVEPKNGKTSDQHLCDLQDTFTHTLKALGQMNQDYFQSYIGNLTCHRYRRAPKYFYITPENKKYDKLKWDWIRTKRSFHDDFKLSKDIEDKDLDADSVLEDFASNDGFEKLYRDGHGIYRIETKRTKRTVNDVDALSRELRNLPPIVVPKDHIYAMAGDSVTLTCPDSFTDGSYSWWMESGFQDNVAVNGPRLFIKRAAPENVGTYTCSKGGRQFNSTHLRVVSLPQFRVVFLPVYRSSRQCNNYDLQMIRQLGGLMTEAGCPGGSCVVKISHPTCSRDEADEHSLLSLSVALVTSERALRCDARCRRDVQCGLTSLAVKNAPVLASVPVIIAAEDVNVTLSPVQRRAGLHSALRSGDRPVPPTELVPGDVDVVLTCPAGYFLVSGAKICVATPPARELLGRRQRRYEYEWLNAPYVVLGACVVCGAVCALVCAARGVRGGGPDVLSKVTTAAPMTSPRRKISPSRVILPRLFRNASSRISEGTKLDFGVRGPPPLPPVDFDS